MTAHSFTKLFESTDDAYMQAVESGDMETAQRMVDEAARRAGFKGSGEDGCWWRSDIPVGLGTDPAISASDFGARQGKLSFGLRKDITSKDLRWPNVIERKPIYLTDSKEAAWYFATSVGYANTPRRFYVKVLLPASPKDLNRVFDEANKRGIRDERGDFFWTPKRTVSYLTEKEVELLEEAGFDSAMGNIDNLEGYELAVFDPENVKLADPAVYDDSDKPIPLSQRFNPASNDIRY